MDSTRSSVAIAVVILLVAAGALWYLLQNGPAPTTSTTASSTTTGVTSSGTPITEGCSGCVGLVDNGKTLAVTETSRVTLILPNQYDKNALSVSPKDSLGETFGASAPVGTWVRTFQTLSPGTATITVPSTDRNAPPYALTIITVDAAHAWENGMTVVRKQDTNQTINLALHERFVLELGSDLKWTLDFSPSGSITRVANSAATGGIQGVYEAVKAGNATLTATGAPICKAGQACPQFLINVTVNFVVVDGTQ
jgi:hypothetical protein